MHIAACVRCLPRSLRRFGYGDRAVKFLLASAERRQGDWASPGLIHREIPRFLP